MSKYTTELRHVCDIFTRDEVEKWFKDYCLYDYLRQEEVETIENAGLWNKDKLARKIVDHYYMREIGFETPALFRHQAKILMQEIMEEKLPLIYSSSIKYDPLINVDYKETLERNVNSSGESNSNSSSSGLSVNSDTPQGEISKDNILKGKWASSTGASENEISDNSNSESNTDENYVKHVIGNSGVSATAQKMIEQYRDNIIAIDRNIIQELNILFMGLY